MRPSELKRKLEAIGSYFFSKEAMRFFGDTMANFGVRSAEVDNVVSRDDQGKPLFTIKVQCWELYRKKPVKNGLKTSSYFRKDNFKRVR